MSLATTATPTTRAPSSLSVRPSGGEMLLAPERRRRRSRSRRETVKKRARQAEGGTEGGGMNGGAILKSRLHLKGKGLTKCRRRTGGCVILVLRIWPGYEQGERGPKSRKLFRRHVSMAPTTNANDDGGDGGSGSSGCGMRYEVHTRIPSFVQQPCSQPTGFPSLSGYKPVING